LQVGRRRGGARIMRFATVGLFCADLLDDLSNVKCEPIPVSACTVCEFTFSPTLHWQSRRPN